ncbi:MAG: MarR family winged helix-turn-helix transcriptional regulator [Pikeienuella sp.]|uniref:MarR family winged helix-turn-helix transcriptional regulator n=1 Tax=Pikeienuella sp. TaxID=2831957 RepID=UPI00391DE575
MFALERFLPYRLAVLAQRVSRDFSAIYRERFGLSVAEWRVLAHLSAAGSVSVREIHLHADLEKSKASRAAARLEEAGLIEKRAGEGDRRLVALTLSPKGRETMAALIPLAEAYEAAVLARLAPEDRAALDRAIAALTER